MPSPSATISALILENNDQIVHSPNWYNQLKLAVDELIVSDFSRLVQILYQMDVPEQKLKVSLKERPAADAPAIIANLMLERQIQRLAARKEFEAGQGFSEEERW